MDSPALVRAVNRILIAAAGVCFAVFLFFFYHYTLTGQREFAGPGLALVYYGVPLAVTALLLGSLKLRPEHRLNLVLVLASLGIGVYFGEHLLEYMSKRWVEANETITAGGHTEERLERIARMAAEEGVDFDTRFWFDVVLDLRDEGVEAAPVVTRADLLVERPDGSLASRITVDGSEVMPLGGVSGIVTVLCNESGEYVLYRSDRHGYHNPEGMWDVERLEVGIIGDSFAQGMCVPSDRSFAALIRDEVPRTLNLGIAGSGPLIQLAVLEEHLRPREPRYVLWFYVEANDHLDLVEESRSPLLMRYLEEGFRQDIADRQDAVDEGIMEIVDEAVEHGLAGRDEPEEPWWAPRELFDLVTRPVKLRQIRGLLGLLDRGPDPPEIPLEIFREITERMASAVSSWGGELHFVYLPARDRYAGVGEFPRDEVLGVVREVGIPIVDLHEAFEAHGDPLALFPFRRMGHYTEEGHRLVAEEVLRATPLGSRAADEDPRTGSP